MMQSPLLQQQPASAQRTGRPSFIEVTGTGTLAAEPDRAVITLGAVTEGMMLQKVQLDNASIIAAVIGALLEKGVPRNQIQTNEFRIDIVYDYADGKQTFRGYKVTHLLQITTDRVRETGLLVDAAVASGANTVTGIRFQTSQPDAYLARALVLAVRSAQGKAQAIAGAIGAILPASPSEVIELPRPGEPIPFQAAAFKSGGGTPIEPGMLTIEASVRVRYSLA
ncbi:MAG: SIMPL domain-containing protein [Paenibacillaceae bacterium]|nr:SIMPL domain-containing protein [Paenibacillaceae bacterium]